MLRLIQATYGSPIKIRAAWSDIGTKRIVYHVDTLEGVRLGALWIETILDLYQDYTIYVEVSL